MSDISDSGVRKDAVHQDADSDCRREARDGHVRKHIFGENLVGSTFFS
jgi:hypothetical protein